MPWDHRLLCCVAVAARRSAPRSRRPSTSQLDAMERLPDSELPPLAQLLHAE